MTWDELSKIIADMDESEKKKVVKYREPWDKEAETFAVDVHEATEDITPGEDSEFGAEATIKKGEYFLQ